MSHHHQQNQQQQLQHQQNAVFDEPSDSTNDNCVFDVDNNVNQATTSTSSFTATMPNKELVQQSKCTAKNNSTSSSNNEDDDSENEEEFR